MLFARGSPSGYPAAMERLLQFPSVSTAMGQRLETLARRHAAVGVKPEDYKLFLECLKETILAFDEAHWEDPDELDRAWEIAVRNGLAAMQKRG